VDTLNDFKFLDPKAANELFWSMAKTRPEQQFNFKYSHFPIISCTKVDFFLFIAFIINGLGDVN